MIKVLTTTNDGGQQTLLLGFTPTNIKQLLAGQPIHLEGSELGISLNVGVFAGNDAHAIIDMLLQGKVIDPMEAGVLRKYYRDNPE